MSVKAIGDGVENMDGLESKELQRRLYKRTLLVVLLSQTLGGAGLAAGITVGALLAKEMLGIDSVSGLPSALFTLGSALAVFLVGRITQKYGRRKGLSFGFLAGSIGALGVVVAANIDSIVLLFISLFVYGAGTSTCESGQHCACRNDIRCGRWSEFGCANGRCGGIFSYAGSLRSVSIISSSL